MHLEYTEKSNSLSWEELRLLSLALGFSVDLFENCMPNEVPREKSVPVKVISKFIGERYFYHDLHFTSNLKTGFYNSLILRKAITMVTRRFLSFSKIQNVRLAFETYEDYDQNGMVIDERTFMRTLKMCGRVISPHKLMHRIGHLKSSYQEEGRIQLFEFFDLLILCEMFDNYKESGKEVYDTHPTEKTWTNLYKVNNFNELVIPQDKKIWKFLNEKYRAEELKLNLKPEWTSHKFTDNPVTASDFHTQVRLSNEEYSTLRKKLKNSSKDIRLAQGGNARIRPKTAPQFRKSHLKKKIYATSLTDDFISESQLSERTKPKKKFRPMSSPPVVNYDIRRDCKEKIDRVQFDLLTEKQRWEDHYVKNISEHLPNHAEVVRRMQKPPKAPRPKRHYRRQRPSTTTIQRLTDTSPKLPIEHMKSCDALFQGHYVDDRFASMEMKAIKHDIKPKKNKSTKPNKVRSRNSVLLQELLVLYNYESSEDEEESPRRTRLKKKKNLKTSTRKQNEEADHKTLQSSSSTENILHESKASFIEEKSESTPEEHKEQDEGIVQKEAYKWCNSVDKEAKIMEMLSENFERVYLDGCSGDGVDMEGICPRKKPGKTNLIRVRSAESSESFTRIHRPQSARIASSQTEELSELEKFILNPENLRIDSEIQTSASMLDHENVAFDRKRKRIIKRIADRYKIICKQSSS